MCCKDDILLFFLYNLSIFFRSKDERHFIKGTKIEKGGQKWHPSKGLPLSNGRQEYYNNLSFLRPLRGQKLFFSDMLVLPSGCA
jgi:hypothetical protein